ncbi:MAG: hypothetical protein ACYC55_01470 [Candidatus Geothermincolia bacterium]
MEESRLCPVCGGSMRGTEDGGWHCLRCGSLARFRGEELEELTIPGYLQRLEELQAGVRELDARIRAEGRREGRDQALLARLHGERQRLLSEYSYLKGFERTAGETPPQKTPE